MSLISDIGRVQNLDFSLLNDHRCGGQNVYIELNQGDILCETSHKVDFNRGTTLSWSGPDLGTCHGKYFDVTQKNLNFKIRSTSQNDFCPGSLTISTDNGYSYRNQISIDDRAYGNHNRIATRSSVNSLGEFNI